MPLRHRTPPAHSKPLTCASSNSCRSARGGVPAPLAPASSEASAGSEGAAAASAPPPPRLSCSAAASWACTSWACLFRAERSARTPSSTSCSGGKRGGNAGGIGEKENDAKKRGTGHLAQQMQAGGTQQKQHQRTRASQRRPWTVDSSAASAARSLSAASRRRRVACSSADTPPSAPRSSKTVLQNRVPLARPPTRAPAAVICCGIGMREEGGELQVRGGVGLPPAAAACRGGASAAFLPHLRCEFREAAFAGSVKPGAAGRWQGSSFRSREVPESSESVPAHP